jgi:prolyl 4-hydroxylase
LASAPRPLDAEWLGWLQTNVARGCAREELKQILLKEGFDAAAVASALEKAAGARVPAPTTAGGPPPRITLNLPNARRFESKSIELYTAERFLSPAECVDLTALIRKTLRPSTISTPPSGEEDAHFRTSSTCDLERSERIVKRLDARICGALGVDPSYGEPNQGQWYEVGQEFKPHTDFFKPYELERFSTEAWGQRTWTFMIYLNKPEGGGATRFVDVDLTIEPRVGMAVLWNNLLPAGEGNNLTRHQGMPVTAGRKVIITKWFRMPRAAAPAYRSQAVSWTQLAKP